VRLSTYESNRSVMDGEAAHAVSAGWQYSHRAARGSLQRGSAQEERPEKSTPRL